MSSFEDVTFAYEPDKPVLKMFVPFPSRER